MKTLGDDEDGRWGQERHISTRGDCLNSGQTNQDGFGLD